MARETQKNTIVNNLEIPPGFEPGTSEFRSRSSTQLSYGIKKKEGSCPSHKFQLRKTILRCGGGQRRHGATKVRLEERRGWKTSKQELAAPRLQHLFIRHAHIHQRLIRPKARMLYHELRYRVTTLYALVRQWHVRPDQHKQLAFRWAHRSVGLRR